MGRKSALTPQQWEEVHRRHIIDKESLRSIAASLAVNESSLRRGIKPQKAALTELASAKVAAEKAVSRVAGQIAELPPQQQSVVNDLARALRATSENLASAAEISSGTARKLSAAAAEAVGRIGSGKPVEENAEALRAALALTKGANDASHIGLNLLAANKGAQLPAPVPVAPDQLPADPVEATRLYREFVGG